MDLEDLTMRDRINCLIDSAADQPYALEIRYHHKCWLKYVRKFQKMSEDDKLPQMQNITYREVQIVFFDHTRKVIFEEHELRSLQSLLRDYFFFLAFTPVQKGTTVNLSMMYSSGQNKVPTAEWKSRLIVAQ